MSKVEKIVEGSLSRNEEIAIQKFYRERILCVSTQERIPEFVSLSVVV